MIASPQLELLLPDTRPRRLLAMALIITARAERAQIGEIERELRMCAPRLDVIYSGSASAANILAAFHAGVTISMEGQPTDPPPRFRSVERIVRH